jgi:molybdenum cofactor biosynthesis enzyme MoaA
VPDAEYPSVPPSSLDTLWFQVAGTLCNLRCTHCFISCSPTNASHRMLSLSDVRARLEEAEDLGVKEYYFTGGEPFLNPEMLEILQETLRRGPATVLTNGMLLTEARCARLRELFDASEYSLDIRVSLDGITAAENDALRGEGTFARILEGIRHLAEAGLNPVVTVTEASPEAGTGDGRVRLLDWLRGIGLTRPRLKVLSLFRIGAEAARARPYASWETLRGRSLDSPALDALMCSSSRTVTDRGVWVCPILIDQPAARLGDSLAEALRPFPLAYGACFTCHEYGVTCRT